MPRTAEVVFVGSAQDLIRASKEAEAAVANAEKGIAGSNVRMGASSKKAAAETEAAHAKVSKSFAGIGRSAVLAGAGIVGLGVAFEGIKRSGDALSEVTKETLALHNVTGLSVKSASAYAAVAQAQGLNAKQLNQAFGTLSKNVQAVDNAHQGLTKAAKTQENAFRLLGVPLQAVYRAHGDLNKLLPTVIAAFERMPGGIQKTAVGMALFGRGWQTLVPLMHSGTLGLKEQLDVAQKMGATLDGHSVRSLKEFAKAQEQSKYATLGLQLAIGQYLAPALTKLVVGMAKVIHSVGEGVKWLEKHKEVALALAAVIGVTLGGALAVYASSRAKMFIAATQDMISGLKALAARMGLTAAVVTTADGEIVAANEAAGASFGALAAGAVAAMAKIGLAVGAAVLAIKGLEGLIKKVTGESSSVKELLGGNQPGESGKEGNIHAMGDPGGTKSHTQGGIMAFFMSKGLSRAQAAGIVGNIEQESGTVASASGGGLFQDIGSRAASGRGSVLHQIEAAWKELTGSERSALEAIKHARTPEQAARIFSEKFERPSEPMLSHRETYARRAFHEHPGPEHAARKAAHHVIEEGAKELEATGHHTKKAAKAIHKATEVLEQNVAAWAEKHIGHFAESTGKNTGPELDKLQAEFHTRAAAWCAEFATTAAMMGGANKAVRTASVATIREWAEQGSHGYRKGIGHTPQKGALMMFGDSHVGFVEAVHGNTVTTIEGNTSAGKVIRRTHQASEGDYAMPKYAAKHGMRLGLEGPEFDRATKAFEKSAKEHAATVKKMAEAVAEARKKLAEQVERWKETFSSLTEKMKELASSAAQAWNTLQSKAIGATHAAAIKGIEGGPVVAEIKAEEETDKRLSRERTEKANAEALKEAKQTGDKKKIKEAEEAITDFARAQDEERKREAVEAAKKAADEQEETALQRLEKETEAYEASLDRQLAALTKLLKEGRISYRAYAADITAIMAGTGVIYKPEKGTEEAVAGGPGKAYPGHPVEGSYTTGPHGERIYHPPPEGAGTGVAARATGGTVNAGNAYLVGERGPELFQPAANGTITNAQQTAEMHFHGDVHMGSRRDAENLANKLAFRLRFG